MGGNEIDLAAFDFDDRANESAALGFAGVLVKPVVSRQDRSFRKNGDAVLSTLIFQIKGESEVHRREPGQLGNLIGLAGARYAAIDFLEPDQIGVLTLNDLSDTRQIELLVHADAYVNVVGHHPDRFSAGSYSQS